VREDLGGGERVLGATRAAGIDRLEVLGHRRRLRAAHRAAMARHERVAQDAQQIAEIVVVAQEARLGQHAGERVLDEVLGILAAPAEGPSRSEEPIDVVAEGGGVERTRVMTHEAPA
jgi:hypothetical protein